MFGIGSPAMLQLAAKLSTLAFGFAALMIQLSVVNGADMSYFCLFPQHIRPRVDFNVSVTMYKPGLVNLSVEVVGETSGSLLVSKTLHVDGSQQQGNSGQTTMITLPIPAILSELHYKIEISGSGDLNFNDSGSVRVLQKSISIFVQTDKALYKPGQKVLFRAVAIYPNMKPYKDWMDIFVYDKDGNRIAQWLKQKSDKGVFSGELSLSDQTPLGTWKIDVQTQVDVAFKTFEVAEYVLPNFEVNVVLPPYYLLYVNKPDLQPSLFFTITAKYTYGQPVKGMARLTAKLVIYPWETDENSRSLWTKTIDLERGEAMVEITPNELTGMVPYSWRHNFRGRVVLPDWRLLKWQSIIITADVTETVTGVTLSSNNTVTCYDKKYDLRFLEITSDSFKPGLVYTGYLALKQKDGSAPVPSDIQLPDGQFRQITISVSPVETCSVSSFQKNISVTLSGYVQFDLEISANCSLLIKASFYDISTNIVQYDHKTVTPFESRAQLGIQIFLATTDSFKVGDQALFQIRTTVPIQTFNYVIVSKGTIVAAQTFHAAEKDSHPLQFYIDHQLAQKLAPVARLVVWFVANNSEIISDAAEFSIKGDFGNNVSVAFDEEEVEPAENVSLTVRGSPGKVAYILAVDQSVLLLKAGNDLTQTMVFDDLKKYDAVGYTSDIMCMDCVWPTFPSGKDSADIFKNAVLHFLTDGYVHKSEVRTAYGMAASAMFLPSTAGKDDSWSSPRTTVRTFFPETWLWNDILIGSDGYQRINAVAPDTITSWVASAFAVSDEDGLGVALLTSQLTVFRSFFISMRLPYSVYRGEEFALQASVFNYLNSTLKVKVMLKGSHLFRVRLESATAVNSDVSKVVEVPGNDAVTVYFWVVTMKLGQVAIEVVANAGVAGDAERRTLLVLPEGVEQQYSTSVLVDHSKAIGSFIQTLKVTLPYSNLVPDSTRLQITVIGDIVGTSLNGLDQLIQIPNGCGEQTMLNLAPIVHILAYLRSTGTLNAQIESKCKAYMLSGYQKELTFQRNDGSFSAFGDRDPAGSIWLSAFVVRTFHQAMSDIPVEDVKMARTINWIIQLQSLNGSFSEPPNGRVLHTEMQGGASQGVTLTAYVLLSLLESRNNSVIDKVLLNDSISKSLEFLEQQLNSISDAYSLCIISYALVLAKSQKSDMAISRRDALAVVANDLKHWEKIESVQNSESFIPPYKQSAAIDIEMTSYALLTYIAMDDIAGALPVAKWLLAQRNPQGGFISTQDTVVALQALASYASQIRGPQSSFDLRVKAKVGLQSHTFDPVTASNMLTLQIWEPAIRPGSVSVSADGQGIALIQMNVKYNLYRMKKSHGIDLTVEMFARDDENTVNVTTCTRWMIKDRTSGMALQTVKLLSGYTFVSLEEVGLSRGLIKNIETDSQSVSIYYDAIDETPTCVSVLMRRDILVDNLKDTSIKIFEYYNPNNFAMAMYGLKLPDTSWQDKCPNCRGEMMAAKENGSGARLFSSFIWVFLLFSELLLTCILCCY